MEIGGDALPITTGDHNDVACFTPSAQQQITGTLVNWKQTIPAEHQLLGTV